MSRMNESLDPEEEEHESQSNKMTSLLRSLGFKRNRRDTNEDPGMFSRNPFSRLCSSIRTESCIDVSNPTKECVCTSYQPVEHEHEHELPHSSDESYPVPTATPYSIMASDQPIVDTPPSVQHTITELSIALRNQLSLTVSPYPYLARLGETSNEEQQALLTRMRHQVVDPNDVVGHTQVDFLHRLVPDLLEITSCPFYWGKMDRYEAERLLLGKP